MGNARRKPGNRKRTNCFYNLSDIRTAYSYINRYHRWRMHKFHCSAGDSVHSSCCKLFRFRNRMRSCLRKQLFRFINFNGWKHCELGLEFSGRNPIFFRQLVEDRIISGGNFSSRQHRLCRLANFQKTNNPGFTNVYSCSGGSSKSHSHSRSNGELGNVH